VVPWRHLPLTGHYPSPVHWMFTGLLIGTSGATAVYTLWLVRRLFTTAPAAAPSPAPAHDGTHAVS